MLKVFNPSRPLSLLHCSSFVLTFYTFAALFLPSIFSNTRLTMILNPHMLANPLYYQIVIPHFLNSFLNIFLNNPSMKCLLLFSAENGYQQ
jgi:hypothetical protein